MKGRVDMSAECKKKIPVRTALAAAILIPVIISSGCSGPDYEKKYKMLVNALVMHEWDISSVTDGKLRVWLLKDGKKELLYGTTIKREKDGVLYMWLSSDNKELKIAHISDHRNSFATHPNPFGNPFRAHKVGSWSEKGNIIATDYDVKRNLRILCVLKDYNAK